MGDWTGDGGPPNVKKIEDMSSGQTGSGHTSASYVKMVGAAAMAAAAVVGYVVRAQLHTTLKSTTMSSGRNASCTLVGDGISGTVSFSQANAGTPAPHLSNTLVTPPSSPTCIHMTHKRHCTHRRYVRKGEECVSLVREGNSFETPILHVFLFLFFPRSSARADVM